MMSNLQCNESSIDMEIGYCRTLTLDIADLEEQKRDLESAGCQKLFFDQISSTADRSQLVAAIDCLRDGDELIVSKLSRLARSMRDLLAIIEKVNGKGATVRVLNLGPLDAATPTGKLMLTMLGAGAAFEREMILERQREGIAKAKGEGK
jgi:DNA invertase Pin-like site-specific DNA recombinase